MREGKTVPPSPLMEADLISKMDEHGIGTDATIHEHIKNIQLRGYAKKAGVHIVPTELGTALVETYKRAGLDLFKPELRAQMETDLNAIAEGEKTSAEVRQHCIEDMSNIYQQVSANRK